MNQYYKGKSVIITGASSGIGRELTKILVERGAIVAAVARRYDKLLSLQQELQREEGVCIPIQTDLTRIKDISEVTKQIYLEIGKIDLLINNASIGLYANFFDTSKSDIDSIILTNFHGTIYISNDIIQHMINNNKGHVVFITSLAGRMGFPQLSVYSATKFGIEGFAEALRHEVKSKGVSVTVCRPGITDTEFFRVAGMHKFESDMRSKGKLRSPHEVAIKLLDSLPSRSEEITIGSDKWFLRALPFIPKRYRLSILNALS